MAVNEQKRFLKWLEKLNDPNIVISQDRFWTFISYKMPPSEEEIIWPKYLDLGNWKRLHFTNKVWGFNYNNYSEAKNWITQCQKIRSNILLKRNLKTKNSSR